VMTGGNCRTSHSHIVVTASHAVTTPEGDSWQCEFRNLGPTIGGGVSGIGGSGEVSARCCLASPGL
jgi:hypothetical protein